MLCPVSFFPDLPFSRCTTPHPSLSSQTTEFTFFSPALRDRFHQAKSGLEALVHPNLLSVLSCSSRTEGLVYTVSIETEIEAASLTAATISKRKRSQNWSPDDVRNLIVQLLAGLTYAASAGFYAVDLSPETVSVTETGFKLAGLARKTDMVFPVFVSPEAWELYVHKENSPSIDQLDPEKLEVYALGALACSLLLNLENRGLLTHGEDLRRLVDSCPEDMRPVIAAMLDPDPSLRPDLATLSSALCPSITPASLVDGLHSAIHSSDYSEARTILKTLLESESMTVEPSFPCSLCGKPMPIPFRTEVMRGCAQHNLCSIQCLLDGSEKFGRTESLSCPCCIRDTQSAAAPRRRILVLKPKVEAPKEEAKADTKTCTACKREFVYKSDEWRMQYYGSVHFSLCKERCSPACMPTPQQAFTDSPVADDDLFNLMDGETAGAGEDKPLSFEERLEEYNSRLLSAQSLEPLQRQSFGSSELSHSFSTFFTTLLTTVQEDILTTTSGYACHLCLRELTDALSKGRWLICGDKMVFVCSQECFRDVLSVDVDSDFFPDCSCPTCGDPISGRILLTVLQSYTERCVNCRNPGTEVLSCKFHYACLSCFQQNLECKKCSKSSDLFGALMLTSLMSQFATR